PHDCRRCDVCRKASVASGKAANKPSTLARRIAIYFDAHPGGVNPRIFEAEFSDEAEKAIGLLKMMLHEGMLEYSGNMIRKKR
ncbi:MAG: hypothetical protein K2I48_07910, partial [Muribaculaceae bacterium]|nr:hypothetical protein [Muribaculaceae bacterium]